MTFDLLTDVETKPDGAASLLTDVLGVGSVRMHPHANKFHAGNGDDGKHYWLTPPELYAQLDAEFHFDFDPCPYPKPADFDGLTCEWGQRNYVNPPFGSIIHQGRKKGPTAWMRKAIEEQRKGKLSVVVYPVDKWVLMMLAACGAQNVRNLGDVKWCATEDGSQGKGTGRHIAAFILTPNDELTRRTIALLDSQRVSGRVGRLVSLCFNWSNYETLRFVFGYWRFCTGGSMGWYRNSRIL